ncbi:MutS-related protein [Bacillus sp. FJAT-22090]|uniref:MutS-related protein n=1 Tax=Bacillus sp. FJAT-22090 TaxID=1581038 RepID=UPI0011A7345F|nr:hypothetical protein [Bacillus sp. FJAT-22090]
MSKLVIILVVVALLLIVNHFLTKDKKKLKKFREEWETGKFIRQNEAIESISSYWSNKKNSDGVDQFTWDDLSMNKVFQKLNYTQTTVGSEYLFNQLREIKPLHEHKQEDENIYMLVANNQALREKILLLLSGLGKKDYSNSTSFFYDGSSKKVKNILLFTFLAMLPIFSVALLFINLKWGLFCLIASFFVNTIVYYRNKGMLEYDLLSITYIASIIHTGKRFSSVNQPEFNSFRKRFGENMKPLKKILFLSNISSLGNKGGGEFDVIFEYIRILFLLDFISYNKIVKTISHHQKEYREVWQLIGKLDAAIAVAFYRKSINTYCTPTFVGKEELLFEKMAHPLIDHPVTNTSALGKCTLVTGSNASGKSTYIKAIAINAILAQTINTALAEKWMMKPSYIATSMAIQDNVLNGDSYFIAEIKSLKRIVQLIEQGKPCISFVDEILKGTNTVERIAASAAMMEWLSSNTGMSVIASHDIELTEIASHVYTNYHFREAIENGEVRFDYTIHRGPSNTRNAIKLLEVLGYPQSITEKANELAENFVEYREWEEINDEKRF